MEEIMSDYRNFDYRDTNDPLRRDASYDPDARAMNAAWGWIAAAVFLVVVLAVAFGIGHQPGPINTAANDTTPPPAVHMAPPASTPMPGSRTLTPNTPAAPISPVPNTAPAQGGAQ
jgi:hypothetical protein